VLPAERKKSENESAALKQLCCVSRAKKILLPHKPVRDTAVNTGGVARGPTHTAGVCGVRGSRDTSPFCPHHSTVYSQHSTQMANTGFFDLHCAGQQGGLALRDSRAASPFYPQSEITLPSLNPERDGGGLNIIFSVSEITAPSHTPEKQCYLLLFLLLKLHKLKKPT
jgi:hypothetical protein